MRECGECTLCCTLTYIPELNKKENVACKYCASNCTIYPSRPTACREYRCAWLAGSMSDKMQPNISHVMVEIYPKMVAVLLAPGYAINDISSDTLEELDTYVQAGLPLIATGQFAKLPIGMTAIEAKHILLDTIKSVKGL